MLATMSNGYSSQLQDSHSNQASDELGLEDRICPGCKKSAVSEEGGLVVAFGQSFFHVDCFKCAKCSNQVTADTNLLLLSDGSPICANCSYSCNICKLPILDEAIMTGDDSYHAHCFKCKVCKNRIDELVFAKTSQGIYCMDCHNERMIKIRKHNERKAAAAAAGGTGSLGSRPRTRENAHDLADVRSPSKRPNGPLVTDAFVPSVPPSPNHHAHHRISPTPAATSPLAATFSPPTTLAPPPQGSVFQPPPRDSSVAASEQARRQPQQQHTLPVLTPPPPEALPRERRRSYDDGTRPLNKLLADGLAAPRSMGTAEKRRSINPGLVFDSFKSISPPGSSSPTLPPPAAQYTPSIRAPGQESPETISPLHDYFFQENGHSRPASGGSSREDTTLVPHPRAVSQTRSSQEGEGRPLRPVTPNSPGVSHTSSAAEQRPVSSHSLGINGRTTPNRSRPSSKADVPMGVDDMDLDSDDQRQHERTDSVGSIPPAPPPKELYDPRPPLESIQSSESVSEADPEASQVDSSDDMSESSPVQERSHATFIAPALPPIRFSLGTDQFSDLFASQSAKPLPGVNEAPMAGTVTPTTPPPSAASFMTNGSISTERSDGTVVASSSSHATTEGDHPSERPLSEGRRPPIANTGTYRRSSDSTRVTITEPGSTKSRPIRMESTDVVLERLYEALNDARERGAHQLKLDRAFVEAIVGSMESKQKEVKDIHSRYDGVKRASKSYIEGLTVAQTEYDQELKARRDAEAEVTRLRVLLSGQAARLTAMSGDSKRQELREQMTRELHDNLSGLEQDLSKLKVQRDMAIAEVEELSANKSSTQVADAPTLGRSLTTRLDKLKTQYQRDLFPLTQQREALQREIQELKGVRDVFLEETTVLNARNEELAQLSNVYARRMDVAPEVPPRQATETQNPPRPQDTRLHPPVTLRHQQSFDEPNDQRATHRMPPEISTPSKAGAKFMKWGSKSKEPLAPQAFSASQSSVASSSEGAAKKPFMEHNFQQLSVLRLTRCDHCGDKMWGSQLRCSVCNLSVHTRCIHHVQALCTQAQRQSRDDSLPLPPSMFGRDLVEQVRTDCPDGSRPVPVIVEKCIEAVEAIALDFEGIYRKTGGSGQSRNITQLFERGDYDTFDLLDTDRFNDICSVTSVLKTYFRTLPNPLLTFELHDQFIGAMNLKDPSTKSSSMVELVHQLPREHYYTLKMLMTHLHRVFQLSDTNLMNARNLGVVFGPTLMRSSNPGAEFADMAGKALSIEWLVENAPSVFGSSH